MADQFKVALPPAVTALGPTLKLTVGVGDLMDTVADWDALPPGPMQVSVKVASAPRMPVVCEPLTALAPHQAPAAEQDVAIGAFHFSVELAPFATVLGVAARVTLGASGLTDTVTD